MSIFRLNSRFKMSFEHNSVRENQFLSACFCWDSGLSSREMDQKIIFGGNIGYWDWYLEFLFRQFKVFRLHAILLDAAGAVRAHGGKVPDSCYMIRRGRTKFMFAWSRDWTTLLPLRKTPSASNFQLCQLLKQYVLHFIRY